MNKSARIVTALAVTLALFASLGCNKLRARDQLNKGVQAYKNARYEDAISHFKDSVQLDPGLITARLYLATAYAQQYVPGLDSPDNNQVAQQAIDQYSKVLDLDPNNINSIKGIAFLYLNMKKFDDAKNYYRKAAAVDPSDPENYYSVGVIDWTAAYQNAAEAKAAMGVKVDDYVKDQKVCEQLTQKNQPLVDEGIDALNKALSLRKDYDDAMAYMNLLYRRRADLHCGDQDARQADLNTADDWVAKTMGTKKAKAEKEAQAAGGQITTQAPQPQ